MEGQTLLIWDAGPTPPLTADGVTYLWNGLSESGSVRSLLRYVEANGERLRSRYLAWIHDLGETRIDGCRVIDHLAMADGSSFWWMTLLVEKSPWKSASVAHAIRLLALDEIIRQQMPAHVVLVSANRALNEAVSALCAGLGLAYKWHRVRVKPRWPSLREAFHSMPVSLQAAVALVRHILIRWPLRASEKAGWFGGSGALFICSYFAGMDEDQAERGEFQSRYWAGLDSLLAKLGMHGNWLHLYVRRGAVPNPRIAAARVKRFNAGSTREGFHALVDAYISWSIIRRVLRGWLTLGDVHKRLGAIEQVLDPVGQNVLLWPMMRQDWVASMRGTVAIENLLWMELFDRALAGIPPQTRGLYLLENQAWERALIHAWRKHGHGELIGVAHATVRFWDLRYFTDVRTLRSGASHPLPQPDVVALNGKAAIGAYLRAGFPMDGIVECEALRFAHLGDFNTTRKSRDSLPDKVKVLVLGDYLPSSNAKLFRMLEAATTHFAVRASFTVKSHPYLPIGAAEYPSLKLVTTSDSLGAILEDFDIVYSSNMTSAALDAYLAGVPVVVMLDDTELNYSPLRGQIGVRFVSDPGELARALHAQEDRSVHRPARDDFLFLNSELPRWSRMLLPRNISLRDARVEEGSTARKTPEC